MESTTRCPACGVRISAKASRGVACPGCGARLKSKAKVGRPDDDPADPAAPARKKKRRKKARSGPNYALLGAAGGGFAVLVGIAIMVAMILERPKRPAADPDQRAGANGGPGQPAGVVQDAGPAWLAKADPPRVAIRPKDDLSISIEGQPVFTSGQGPFMADVGSAIDVYDLRTGQKTTTAKAVSLTTATNAQDNRLLVALGPDGKTLAVRTSTTTGTGRKAVHTSEAVVYRLGQEAPIARINVPQHLVWMEFGRDDDQLLLFAASAATGFQATAHNLKTPDAQPISLDIPRSPIRWRLGFTRREVLAVSPGRNYLAVGEGRWVEVIQLSDGKLAGRCDLPGDCVSVAFSADGSELAVHSHITPPRGSRGAVPVRNQWTTFALADGKQRSIHEVDGGSPAGPILATGPKPGLAIHADHTQVTVADTRFGAPVFSMRFPALRYFDGDRLLGFDAGEKRVVVQRIDLERVAAAEKVLLDTFGPRPAAVAIDRTAVAAAKAPAGWAVPVDAVPEAAALGTARHTVAGGAEFVMPWTGKSSLAALPVRHVATPRDRYALMWEPVDLATGRAESTVELWPSVLPVGQIPPPAGRGTIVADQTADGSRLAVRDAAATSRVDVWDRSGKRLVGFVPYGPETPVDALIWVADNRLITRGGGKLTGWEVPGARAVFELAGYVGTHALSPGRKWIGLQSDKHIDVFDTATGSPLGRLEHANPTGKPWHGFAVSRDGLHLAAVEQARAAQNELPSVWAVGTWDLKTGQAAGARRLFGGYTNRSAQHLMWLGPRLLLAGGTDVIDLDALAVTAVLGVEPPHPMPSPDGRYWGGRSDRTAADANQVMPIETVFAIGLDDATRSLPRPAAADVVFRDGVSVEVVSSTGDNGRDAVIRSQLGQLVAAEGYGTGRGGWRLTVTGQRTAGSGASLETPTGTKIRVPGISGKMQLTDAAGQVAWEASVSGGWDMNQSKYKTGKDNLGPMGGSITHFNFGLRDPVEAMADEAWDNFVGNLRSSARFPRVFAQVNGKLVALPVALPVPSR